ncbi:MAG: diacetylchitobiose ABC transporter ATP-binding protein MsiK [Mycobacteriales bacterium]
MAQISYEAATRTYPGESSPAVDRLDLEIADGEFLVLVGASGSGKTTALRMLAGLEKIDSGRIKVGDRDVTDIPARSRDMAMVFQSYALYPHMSVADNMAFALRMQKVSKDERMRRVREAATLLDLDRYLDRKPKQLSGGQRQRVAMGRAIVRQPKAFLMDEPLSNLDAKLRVQTRTEIAALQQRLGTTTVYVTHDQVEAMTMGHRVAVLDAGRLLQCDTPRALYDRPNSVFVAGFIGSPSMNLRTVPLRDGAAMLGDYAVPLPAEAAAAAKEDGLAEVVFGVRPEGLDLAEAGHGLAAVVDFVEELGSDTYLHTSADLGRGPQRVIARIEGDRRAPAARESVHLAVRGSMHAFSPATGRRLGT